MMKEKDIKEILDDKFESMAPDLVNKICENKIEKIKDESELFGNDEPLFRKNNKVIFGGIVTAMVACIMIVIMVFSPKQQFMLIQVLRYNLIRKDALKKLQQETKMQS